MTQRYRALLISLLVNPLWVATGVPAHATPLSAETVDLTLGRQQRQSVELDYRLAPEVVIDRVRVTSDGVPLPVAGLSPYPWKGAQTAILILIDTSASRHPATVQRNLRDLARIVTAAPPRLQMGLAVFDSEMRVLAPVGSRRDALLEALRNITARGQTTELFRCTRDAVALLARISADRRAVMILSDGGAEDTAYRSEDVRRAARRAGVAIIGLGFAERPTRAVALQSLRRLAEETMGVFVVGGAHQSLPEAFLAAPFAGIETGGRFDVNLSPAASPLRTVDRTLMVTVEQGDKTATVPLVVHIPRRPPTGTEVIGSTGIGATLVMAGIYMLVRHNRNRPATPRTIALLDCLDSDARVIPITKTRVTLGRRDDNDIRLGNDTVSEHHALIRRRRDGTFEIVDLDSTNGVAVNGRRVDHIDLADGDLVTLGEVRFRFRHGSERTS